MNVHFFLFQINDEPMPDVRKNKNEYPFIIACGENPEKLTRFFIQIKQQLFFVPSNFTFIETVDLFLKIHLTLKQKVDPRLQNVFLFIYSYIFKLENSGYSFVVNKIPFTKMTELASVLEVSQN